MVEAVGCYFTWLGDPMHSLLQCAIKGAAFLDKKAPGWERHIDLVRLDMSSKNDCVLGQLWGTYERGLWRCRMLTFFETYVSPRALELGFAYFVENANQLQRSTQYLLLTEFWKRQVELRLAHHSA